MESNYQKQSTYESIFKQVLDEFPDLSGLEQARLADEIFIEFEENKPS